MRILSTYTFLSVFRQCQKSKFVEYTTSRYKIIIFPKIINAHPFNNFAYIIFLSYMNSPKIIPEWTLPFSLVYDAFKSSLNFRDMLNYVQHLSILGVGIDFSS